MRFKKIIKQQPEHSCGNTADNHLDPHHNYALFYLQLFIGIAERKHFLPKHHNYRHNRAELNYNEKHFFKFLGHFKRNKSVKEQHMPRAAYGQPFGYTLDNSYKYNLNKFNKAELHRNTSFPVLPKFYAVGTMNIQDCAAYGIIYRF